LAAQGVFEIPSSGEIGYRDLVPLEMSTLLPNGEIPELMLLCGPEAIPVYVTPELIADENGRVGGIISLSWFDDDDTPRLLELPASGRLRMRSSTIGAMRLWGKSEFHHEWNHALDVRAAIPGATLRLVGSSRGESSVDPTLAREWTLDLTSRVEGLGDASARAMAVFGNEATVRMNTTEGIFGAENTQLRQWSGDANLVLPSGEVRGNGSMTMETHYLEPDGNILGTFLLRAENGHTRTVVSGWVPVTYDEAAIAVSGGTFDFATLGLMETNRLFATPAFTTHTRLRWDDEFWDRGQISPPLQEW
jgi:hypothetical protein